MGVLWGDLNANVAKAAESLAPVLPLIRSMGWPTIDDIIRSKTATIIYKSLNGLVPDYLSNLFEKSGTRNVRKLRNADTDLSQPLQKTNNGQRAISFRETKLWNQLEPDPKTSSFPCHL